MAGQEEPGGPTTAANGLVVRGLLGRAGGRCGAPALLKTSRRNLLVRDCAPAFCHVLGKIRFVLVLGELIAVLSSSV